eukprot:CAMPEP_0177614494 /NCGR_PEP_ID=MMETSP0419_2-20121207/22749_1 /TAXON_ID=582737 /ORGANISM="Tetraselmis sp., Strain GSL018" /LENGTH=258 /DNA_ID=CAMNT_0019111683 /DNA_START=921 /DNA_END=1698 /DNA_ORIENTATION=-
MLDGSRRFLPVYIGEAECAGLLKELEKRAMPRPLTYDMMKTSLEAIGYRVTKVCVTALVGTTYHGSIHYRKSGEGSSAAEEVVVDSRPSDAINMAVRFGAAMYIHKRYDDAVDLVPQLGGVVVTLLLHRHLQLQLVHIRRVVELGAERHPPGDDQRATEETKTEIIESVRAQILQFNDPTYMYKLQLQMAVQEERYDDAAELRDKIDGILASNRELGLIVAMETALDDERYEEAAALRDEFIRMRSMKEQRVQPSDGI